VRARRDRAAAQGGEQERELDVAHPSEPGRSSAGRSMNGAAAPALSARSGARAGASAALPPCRAQPTRTPGGLRLSVDERQEAVADAGAVGGVARVAAQAALLLLDADDLEGEDGGDEN